MVSLNRTNSHISCTHGTSHNTCCQDVVLKVLFFCLDLPRTVRFAFQMQICQEAFETLSSLFILCYTSISLPNILHAAPASKMRPPHCLYFSRKYFPGIPNMESTNLTHKLIKYLWAIFYQDLFFGGNFTQCFKKFLTVSILSGNTFWPQEPNPKNFDKYCSLPPQRCKKSRIFE